MDIEEEEDVEFEIFLNYKGVVVYYLYKDLISRDSIWEYHYTLDLSDTDGFDVRELSTYNKELSIEENLKIAIDKDLL